MTSLEWVVIVVLGVLLRLAVTVLVLAALALPVIALMEAVPPLARLARRIRGIALVEGLAWRTRRHYGRGHTWVNRTLARGFKVGVDALVPRLLPTVSGVALPAPGTLVHRGDVVGELSGDGHCAPVIAPVDGTVLRVNRALFRHPELARRDPYGRGWLFAIAPAEGWRRGLRQGAVAREWFALEARRLGRTMEGALGMAAADGGQLVGAAPALVGDAQWDDLVVRFLRPDPALAGAGPTVPPAPPSAPAP